MANNAQELIPASTVVLVREGISDIEVLLLRRNAKLNFAGGNWVFPGGRIDDADFVADDISGDSSAARKDRELSSEGAWPAGEFTAAIRAAVRETQEEAGLDIEINDLIYFSHWVAPPLMPKRFSTWFFITALEVGMSNAVEIDGGEIHEHRWISPTEALSLAMAKEFNILPPTLVTLTEMAQHKTTASLLNYYDQRNPVVFRPHVYMGGEQNDGRMFFLYEGDAGYENTDPDASGLRHRVSLLDEQWAYENTVFD